MTNLISVKAVSFVFIPFPDLGPYSSSQLHQGVIVAQPATKQQKRECGKRDSIKCPLQQNQPKQSAFGVE